MKVAFNRDESVTVVMTPDELNAVRYALAEGVQRLRDTALRMAMRSEEADNARSTATRCWRTAWALETATIQATKEPVPAPRETVGPVLIDPGTKRCRCDCGTTCPAGKMGMEHRCSIAELTRKGIPFKMAE